MTDNKKKELILQCRFFNDEKDEPKWMSQNEKMFWFYESCWITDRLQGNTYSDYLQDYPKIKTFELNDGTPQDLKALLCDRYCHFGGRYEEFTVFYKNEYQVRLTNQERTDKEWEIRHCRLFNGNGPNVYERTLRTAMSFREPRNGYKENKTEEEITQILSIFYGGEVIWVKSSKENSLSKNQYAVSQFESELGMDFEEHDGTPRQLKIVLYNYFLDWIDGWYNRFYTSYEIELFKRYYREFYQPHLTPNQKREQERRPGLIEKCRYYKGEKDNPWEFCYSPVLDFRKRMWSIEKEWVDSLATSYDCPQSSRKLIKDFVLTDFFKAKGIALSLINLIVSKEKEEAEERNEYFGPAEAIKVFEKYEKLTPLGRDHRMYFAYFLGEKDCPYGYTDEEEYLRMGWSQESMQLELCHTLCDFEDKDFQGRYRGREGIWGWYADPKYPRAQKDILFFAICNWGRWCPYCDEDKLAEEYLNYHYPGDGRPRHSDRFYHNAAFQAIKDEGYYKSVRKCGMYEGRRVYSPVLKDEYKQEPPCIGLPLVILVDDDGNAEYIRSSLSFDIYDAVSKNKKK